MQSEYPDGEAGVLMSHKQKSFIVVGIGVLAGLVWLGMAIWGGLVCL